MPFPAFFHHGYSRLFRYVSSFANCLDDYAPVTSTTSLTSYSGPHLLATTPIRFEPNRVPFRIWKAPISLPQLSLARSSNLAYSPIRIPHLSPATGVWLRMRFLRVRVNQQ